MSGVMNPVPAGLPSQSIFLTPPVSSFLFSAAAPEDGAAAASPNPATRVAKRPANALRVNRLAGGEMPKRRARFRIHSFERLRIVPEEDQSRRRAHGSSTRVSFACLR